MKKVVLLLFLSILIVSVSNSRIHKKVLFIGNSLTVGMPEIVETIAKSQGDSLYFVHVLGAAPLDTVDNFTKGVINSEEWDYVVVQYNHKIRNVNKVIKNNSECTQTVVYMMWGWENGNNSTMDYFEQQDYYRTIYKKTADEIEGICVPAGISWKEVRTKKPWIYLYGGDNYHPNNKGMYLTACTFYSTFFEQSPEGANNNGLPDSTATFFQQVAASVVLDSLETWNINEFAPNNSPEFINPKSSESVASLVTFEWESDESIDSYNLQVATDEDFKNIIFAKENIGTNSYTHDVEIYNAKIYTRLNGNYSTPNSISCNTAWRYIDFFTLHGGPNLYYPENETSCLDRTVPFDWERLFDANSYIIQLASDSSFTDIILQEETFRSSYLHKFDNDENNIFWRVQKYNGFISEKWSKPNNLALKDIGPDQLVPENYSINIPNSNTILTWDETDTKTGQSYSLQLSEDTLFKNKIVEIEELTKNEFIFNSSYFATQYFWRVKNTSNECPTDWSEVHSFKTKLQATKLISPINRKSIESPDTITLVWDSNYDSANHQVIISSDSNFNDIVDSMYDINESTVIIYNLLPSTKYFWKVISNLSDDVCEPSEIWEFTTSSARVDSPILLSPENRAIDQKNEINFKWQYVQGADSYTFEISNNKQFSESVDNYSDIKLNEIDVSNMINNRTYYWRVKSLKDEIESNWSDVWYFKTSNYNIEEKVELLSPKDQSTNINESVMFNWEILPGVESYRFQLSNSTNFEVSNLLYNESITETNQTLNNLAIDTEYFWRVRGENSSGVGQWSIIYSFTTSDAMSSVLIDSYNTVIYPNPSQGIFNIESEISFTKINILDLKGVLIRSISSTKSNNYSLNLSNELAKGIYFIELENENVKTTSKFIVE